MFLAYGAGILFIGFVLLLASLQLRRKGEGLRCRNCDYDLAGIDTTDARCPECGTRLNARTIINTDRADILHRARPIFRVLGSLAVVAGVVLLLVALYRWPGRYPYTPSWFLVGVDLPTAFSNNNQRVIDELIRRRTSGNLSNADAVAAGRIIIDSTSGITPQQYLTGTGSFGNQFLHPLIEKKLLTVGDLARSHSMAGQIRIKVSPFIKGGILNTSIIWKSNYLFGLPETSGMPRVGIERTDVLVDGEPLEGYSNFRNYGKHQAINHIHTERFLSLTDDEIPPGEHTLTILGNVIWFESPDPDAPIAARTPFEVSINVVVPEEDLPEIEFLSDREYADTVTEAIGTHSYVTPTGTAVLMVEEPLDEDVVIMFDAQVKIDGNWVEAFYGLVKGEYIVFDSEENNMVKTHLLWNITVPKGLDLTKASTVQIRLVPKFNKTLWYQRGFSPDQRFLDQVIELALPVRNSRSR